MEPRFIRVLGATGSALTLFIFGPLVAVPWWWWVVPILGIILEVLALRSLSEMVEDREVLMEGVIGFALWIGSIIALAGLINSSESAPQALLSTMLGSLAPSARAALFEQYGGFIGEFVLLAVVSWILFIASAFLIRRTFLEIADETKAEDFRKGTLSFLVGSIIVFTPIGWLLILYSLLVHFRAFLFVGTNAGVTPEEGTLGRVYD